MLTVYLKTSSGLQRKVVTSENSTLLDEAIWIDLLSPSKEEEKWVERSVHLSLPSKEEMQEIELSSRLYCENEALFMTAMMVANSDLSPVSDAISFILTKKTLITVRYVEPQAFELFTARLTHLREVHGLSAAKLLIVLLEAAIDRLADILEKVIQRVDQFSQNIFRPKARPTSSKSMQYQKLLQEMGINDDLGTKARESLISFNLLVSYLRGSAEFSLDEEDKSRLKIAIKDILALSDHASFISNKTNFLLNATLGFVNIEQNNIIKIFSVVAVIFLPPTLIASIYGMNFHFMPELDWSIGYPTAVILMILSAWLPFKYFKRRKWL